MQSLIRSKSAGVTDGRGTAGAGPGRDLLYWSLGRGAGLCGRAVVAGSVESTASRLQWLSCGCGVIRTW